MKSTSQWLTVLPILSASLSTLAAHETQRCRPWEVDRKPRVFILSDICNEPDDAQSMVRLLTHADQYDIRGLVATTSYWLNDTTVPDEIVKIVKSYGSVLDNLQVHGHGQYPTEEHLLSVIKSGPKSYGLAAVDAIDAGEQISDGAQLLIDAVDASSEPLYVQAWGGANTIAEALRYVQSKRQHAELVQFCEKMRVYAISDQDNAGAWVRHEFPQIRYIASVHSWNAYGLAAWSGMSGEGFYGFDDGGPNSDLTSDEWIKTNIQLGALGKSYPDIVFIMEGDSPAMLFTMQNGLNAPEHPEWGGWGGRYAPSSHGGRHFADTADHVRGKSGKTYMSNHATIWRWRQAYQNEFAARMQWTLYDERDARTSHPPVVVVNGSCGSQPVELEVDAGSSVVLDATESYDADSGKNTALTFSWWMYREITATQWQVRWEVPELATRRDPAVPGGSKVVVEIPSADESCRAPRALHMADEVKAECQVYHVILEVSGPGAPPMTRYRRVILKVRLPEQEAQSCGSPRHEEL
ncbi:cellulose-binding protein [Diplodia corticola]|uniref:Cellulose-binding protein n=1 Tax=Diplodia corticola TaxID=236234 RepID=A0A1J9R6S8_9PEZI|nr:cellulose-binding protein [Diplodia corticola]OJD35930.1 cellulose-binding protein [Diplodia corticola]